MSPEQLSGDDLTPASDTFALGVIAYELITGQRPFKPHTAYQLLDEQRAGVEVPPRELRPELHAPAQAAILRALSFDPSRRQQRTRDFGNEVYRSITGATAPLSGPLTDPLPALPPRPTPRTRIMETNGVPPASDAHAPEPPPTADLDPEMVAQDEYQEEPAYVPPPPPVAPPPHNRTHKLLFVAAGLLLLFSVTAAAVVGYFVWKRMSEPQAVVEQNVNANVRPTPRATATPTPAPTATPQATARLSLEYSLTIQMMRGGKPYREPLESTGRERYESGTRAWMNISSPSAGYLYLLNEGPDDRGNILYSLLYPANGDARLSGAQKIQIPGDKEHFFEFKHGTGTEKIWIIWSEQPVPEMEALKGLMNEEHNWGDITDPAQIETVRAFLSRHDTSKTEAVEDNDKMTIKSSDDVLVYRSELKHY
jgi:hypothetical protein